MTAEAGVALASAWKSRSPALLGFGGDSLIELLSAAVVFQRFRDERVDERTEKRTAKIAGILLFALAACVVISSAAALLGYRGKAAFGGKDRERRAASGCRGVRPVRLHGLDCFGGAGGQCDLAESLDRSRGGVVPYAHHCARGLAKHAREALR